MFFGKRHEMRWLDRSELGMVPAYERFDLPEAAVAQRDLGLVDHVQPLVFQRLLKAAHQPQFGQRAHGTKVALRLASSSSSTSKRTGFSTGPVMLRPIASPRRDAGSSTRR